MVRVGLNPRPIIGFSFGYRKNNPGDSNRRLIDAVRETPDYFVRPLYLQYELAACINDIEERRQLRGVVYGPRIAGEYLNSDECADQFAEMLKRDGHKEVDVLAHPFIHRWYCARTMRKRGFSVGIIKTGWISFDKKNEQWWTRGPIRCVLYCAIGFIFKGRR